jgi:hypothetical protein
MKLMSKLKIVKGRQNIPEFHLVVFEIKQEVLEPIKQKTLFEGYLYKDQKELVANLTDEQIKVFLFQELKQTQVFDFFYNNVTEIVKKVRTQ